MNKLVGLLLVIASISVHSQSVAWPPLPKQGFITGRAATQADVTAGNAVFSAALGDVVVGTPMRISVPQYAYHLVDGKKIPVIVVQAE